MCIVAGLYLYHLQQLLLPGKLSSRQDTRFIAKGIGIKGSRGSSGGLLDGGAGWPSSGCQRAVGCAEANILL